MVRPEATIVGLARDVDAAQRLLGAGLGMPTRLEEHPNVGRSLTVAAANGALVIVEPSVEHEALSTLLGDLPGLWVGTVAGEAPEDVEELVRAADTRSGALRLSVARGVSRSADAVGVAIDHVAYAVADRRAALDALPGGLDGSVDLGTWEFPALGSATAMVGLRDAFVELNEPSGEDGYFGGAVRSSGGRPVFAVLRVDDVGAARDALVGRGHRVAEVEQVLARPEGSTQPPRMIAEVAPIPRRECSGLPVMIIETRWPWSGPGSPGVH